MSTDKTEQALQLAIAWADEIHPDNLRKLGALPFVEAARAALTQRQQGGVTLSDKDWQAIADDADAVIWSRIKQAVDRRLAALTAARPAQPQSEMQRLAGVALRESAGEPITTDWAAAALEVCRLLAATPDTAQQEPMQALRKFAESVRDSTASGSWMHAGAVAALAGITTKDK